MDSCRKGTECFIGGIIDRISITSILFPVASLETGWNIKGFATVFIIIIME
jgi:hypothetical protein